MLSFSSPEMKQLTQQESVELVMRQKARAQLATQNDIRDVELSGFPVSMDLDAITIAMSTLSNLTFNASSTLYGVEWIGNEIRECSFIGTPMNKSEVLDCTFKDSRFSHVELFRTDFSGTVFKDCLLEAVDLSNACLINTTFENCTFSNVVLNENTSLHGRKTISFDSSGAPQHFN
jgi:uncharacterized protein YjbI with pentapeptide repeats